jgi:hypothetical protein
MKMVAKGILKDHLVLVADSMVSINIKKRFNNAGYKATFCPLKGASTSYSWKMYNNQEGYQNKMVSWKDRRAEWYKEATIR